MVRGSAALKRCGWSFWRVGGEESIGIPIPRSKTCGGSWIGTVSDPAPWRTTSGTLQGSLLTLRLVLG